jgi:hypothetical protein
MDFSGPRTQKLLEASATNETVVLYTVPAEKVFWLVSSEIRSDGGAVGEGRILIRDAGDVIKFDVGYIKIGVTTENVPSIPYTPSWPIEIGAGWDIAVISGAASLIVGAEVFGFEVDA